MNLSVLVLIYIFIFDCVFRCERRGACVERNASVDLAISRISNRLIKMSQFLLCQTSISLCIDGKENDFHLERVVQSIYNLLFVSKLQTLFL